MRVFILVSLVVFLAFSIVVAQVPAVEISLTVSDGAGGMQELRFGLDPTATDTMDSALGEAELPPPPPIGVFDARFIGNDIAIEIGQGLLRDYRQGGMTTVGTKVHEVLYQVGSGTAITISWDFPETVEGRLQDIITGSVIDTVMRGSSSYTVTNPGAIQKLKMTVSYTFATPAAPALSYPSDGAIVGGDTLVFGWLNTLPNVQKYWFEISTDAFFSSSVIDSSVADTSYLTSGLIVGNTYWWRVRAYNAAGWGPFSDTRSLEVLTLPAKVVLLSPADGMDIQNDKAFALWQASSPNVTRYWCEIATDSLFTFRIVDSSVTDTAYMFTGLTPDVYWWRVRAGNAMGWGLFSVAWRFSVTITGLEERDVLPKEYSLAQNYPNPFNPATNIRYGIPEATYVSLKLYNSLGELVSTLVDWDQQAGYHEVAFDASEMASGMYFYRLQAGDFVATKKMLVVK
jgi:hypothetical protein